ncbi:MAG TPA: ribosome silencing factor [Acidisarcina sp.]
MASPIASKETRRMVLAAAAACEDKKAIDTRVLELDPMDSGFTDFFLITSGANERQTVAIADEIEQRLKKDFGLFPNSVEGRRLGEWVLLDYFDFVVHIFQTDKRAFYDIERLRKSARSVDLAELKIALAEKVKAVRGTKPLKPASASAGVPAKKTAQRSKVPAKKAAANSSASKKVAANGPATKPRVDTASAARK